LTRQIHSLRNAVRAEVDQHVWREGFRHKGAGLVQDLRIPFRIGVQFVNNNPPGRSGCPELPVCRSGNLQRRGKD
jgi:hypothetical protein